MQISKSILSESATLYPYTGTVNSVKTYSATVSLANVRFVSIRQNAMTSLGDMKNDKYKMFFDCVNSAPSGMTFKKDDKIVYGSLTLYVRAVENPKALGTAVHHWEVSLV